MTRLEALKSLLAKVEAGEWFPGLAQLSFGGVQNYHDAKEAYHGSLDAAKALHKEFLPGWGWSVQNMRQGMSYALVVSDDDFLYVSGDTPARAWLIAILKALIAKEEG